MTTPLEALDATVNIFMEELVTECEKWVGLLEQHPNDRAIAYDANHAFGKFIGVGALLNRLEAMNLLGEDVDEQLAERITKFTLRLTEHLARAKLE